MPTFVVTHYNYAMKVTPEFGIVWVSDARTANTYTSKYQARRHLKELDNVPEDVKIVEVQTVEDEING